MDVRIGVTQTPKELEVELPDDADADGREASTIDKALADGTTFWLTDRKGRQVGVPGREDRLRRDRPPRRRAPHRLRRLTGCGRWADHLPVGRPAMTALLDRKLLFVTGKGGVGKTTIAASLGLLASQQGKRTLVVRGRRQGQPGRLLRGRPHRVQAARGRSPTCGPCR